MAYITSAQSGPWSSTSTWTGGVVPGDGHFVLIQSTHQVTLDQNIGTAGNGIKRIAINGSNNTCGLYCSSPAAAYTVIFGSTGTDPIGTGTTAAPAEDATMHGFWVPRGTLSLVGTLANPITITTGDDTNPIYIRHNWTDGTSGSIVQFGGLTLQYCDIRHLGKNAAGYEGIYWDFRSSGTASVTNCKISDYWIAFQSSSAPSSAPVITSNWFTGRKGTHTIYFAQQFASNINATIEDNTETSPTVSGNMAYWLYEPAGTGAFSVKRNFVYSSSSSIRVVLCRGHGGSTSGTWNIDGNACLNTPTTTGTVTAGAVAVLNRAKAGSTFAGNVCEYPFAMLDANNGLDSTMGIAVSDSFCRAGRDGAASQGAGAILRKGVNSVANCICAVDTDSSGTVSGVVAWFDYKNNASYSVTTVYNHVTVYSPGVTGTLGILASEAALSATNDQIRNCLLTTVGYGIQLGNSATTFAVDYAGVGVHHNCTHGSTVSDYSYQGGATALQTNGWSNGTNAHPNAVYADITSDPQFLDASRTVATWDASLGGAGTRANVATELAKRSGFGGTYNTDYTIANLKTYLFTGFRPTNSAFLASGSDGTAIGAVDYVASSGGVIFGGDADWPLGPISGHIYA